MSLPLRKEKDKIILKISKKLYKPESIKKAMDEFPQIVKESEEETKGYQRVIFNKSTFKEALAWANYLFFLNR